ncbi:MAG: TonB-dependent receptor, partial [Candidatus Zixiibacteriota bacterium]
SNWGMFNRHVLLLLDGRPVKDYSLGGFNLAAFSSGEFDRVELLKGPHSSIYGSDALGGVLNLIPRSMLVDRLTLTSQVGTFGSQSYAINGSRVLGSVGLGGYAEFSSADNHRPNSGVERTLAGLRVDHMSLDGHHSVSLSGRYFQDSLGVPSAMPDPNSIPMYGNELVGSIFNFQRDDNYSVDLRYRFFDERMGEARLDLFWEKQNLDYNSLYYDGYVVADVYSRALYNKRSSGICMRYQKKTQSATIAGGVDWLSGSLGATQTDSSVEAGGITETYTFWKGSQDQIDVWSNITYDISSYLTVDLSGRVHFVKDRKMQPSYNLGLIHRPTETIRFKAGYAYAFRLPSMVDQFADEFYVTGNTNLNPETSRSWLITIEYGSTGSGSRVSLTFFRQRVDSLIQYDWSAWPAYPINIDKLRSVGLDLGFTMGLLDRGRLTGSFVYQDAEQTQGGGFVQANFVPEIKWRLDLSSDITNGISSSVTVAYTSDRSKLYGDMPKTIGKVYEFGASVAVKPTDYVRFVFSGEDLTDRARPDQFGFSLSDRDFPGPGRRFHARVELDIM